MEAITGVFDSRSDAEGTVEKFRASGLSADKVTLLTPGEKAKIEKELHTVPVVAAEQSGMGKTIGGVVGAPLVCLEVHCWLPSYPASGQYWRPDCWAQQFLGPQEQAWERSQGESWRIQ